jgi:hypothetical protein
LNLSFILSLLVWFVGSLMVRANRGKSVHRLSRKNCRPPEMGLVTVFCPLTTTGGGRLVVHAGEKRSVVDWRVNPVALVGHVKITFAAARLRVSCGGVVGKEMLNTVPYPKLPP